MWKLEVEVESWKIFKVKFVLPVHIILICDVTLYETY